MKKIASLILVGALMVMSFVGCNKSTPEDGTQTTEAGIEAETTVAQ